MSAGIGELFIQLAFKGDAKGAEAFKKKIDEVVKAMNGSVKVSNKAASTSKENIASLIKGYFAVVAAIKTVIATYNSLINSMSSNQVWINLARQTDLAMSSLQSYANVASVLDKSLGMEGAAQGIANLEQRLYELQLTGQGGEGFMYAGINPMGKNAFQIIEELRSRIAGLSDNQATFLLKQMGIDPRMLGMLRMTRKEFEALRAELRQYELTEVQREAMQKLQEQLTIVSKKFQYFKDRVILAILPYLVKCAKGVLAVAQAFANVLQSNHPLAVLTKIVTGLTAAVIALGVAIWAITAHPIVALITAIIGAIMGLFAAIYLIVDDIIGWMQGKDSVIGYLLGMIDEIVSDERVPKWIRDLLYIIGQAPEVLTKLDKYLGNKPIEEQSKEELDATAQKTLISRIWKNIGWQSLAGLSGPLAPLVMGKGMLDNLQDVGKSIKIFNQYNTINTSEAANTVQEEFKHAQTVNNLQD